MIKKSNSKRAQSLESRISDFMTRFDLKSFDAVLCLSLIKSGAKRQVDLIKLTGLNKSKVSRKVAKLIEQGLVLEFSSYLYISAKGELAIRDYRRAW